MINLFKKTEKVKSLTIYDKLYEYFPSYDPRIYDLGIYFSNKIFQAKVLFPWCNVPCPTSYTYTEFKENIFPVFVKDSQETDIFYSLTEYQDYIQTRFKGFEKYTIIQDNITPVTFNQNNMSFASHLRLVINYAQRINPVLGAVLLYNPNIAERRSNGRHGGIAIPLTGNGKHSNISEIEMKILDAWNINPENREIPDRILTMLFDKTSPANESLFDFCSYSPTTDLGIDIMLGRSQTDIKDMFYFLELNHAPANKIIAKSDAWIRY
jgi:hypothetical protein